MESADKYFRLKTCPEGGGFDTIRQPKFSYYVGFQVKILFVTIDHASFRFITLPISRTESLQKSGVF
jgi:hypothetical protein